MEPITYVNDEGDEYSFYLQHATLYSEEYINIHICKLTAQSAEDAYAECLSFPKEVAVKIAEAIMLSENPQVADDSSDKSLDESLTGSVLEGSRK